MRLSVDNFIALLSGSIAAWLERRAAARIEYLKAENRALRSRLAGRRIIFTDAERRTLATLAKGLGRKALRDLDPIVTPVIRNYSIGGRFDIRISSVSLVA